VMVPAWASVVGISQASATIVAFRCETHLFMWSPLARDLRPRQRAFFWAVQL
jgi:hypothetical protein